MEQHNIAGLRVEERSLRQIVHITFGIELNAWAVRALACRYAASIWRVTAIVTTGDRCEKGGGYQ